MIVVLVVGNGEKSHNGGILAGFGRLKASSYRDTMELVIGLRIL